MKRLELENHNTKEYYNDALNSHFDSTGMDYDDMWRIEALLKEYDGEKLLDIGCGIAPLCLVAKGKYPEAEVYGIDFADELIEKLKTKYAAIHYSVADFYSLPFENESFGYVTMGELLEHSEEPQRLIYEAMRILKKGGTLAISTPNDEKEKDHYYNQHIWSFTEEDMRGMFQNPTIKIINNNIIVHAKKD